MKIIIVQSSGRLNRSDSITPEHLSLIKKSGKGVDVKIVDETTSLFKKELLTANALISSRMINFPLTDAPELKWLHITSAGINDLSPEIINSDIMVTNSSGVHPIPISEHVFGLMLMLSRGLMVAYRNQLEKKTWIRDARLFPGIELAGTELVIVGMGRIGERIAKLGEAFDMNVTGIVRDPSKHKGHIPVYSTKSLESQLRKADFVINCLPSTEETKGMFNKSLFAHFKKGSFYINIGRGDTTVEYDLITALHSKQLAGAGLDVAEVEPLPDSSPLWSLSNVIITPHISGLNAHYTDRMIAIFIENLKSFMSDQVMPNLVNKELGY